MIDFQSAKRTSISGVFSTHSWVATPLTKATAWGPYGLGFNSTIQSSHEPYGDISKQHNAVMSQIGYIKHVDCFAGEKRS